MKSNFKSQEKMMLKVIFEEQRGMSIKEVAEKSQMSWITAKKYIEKFVKNTWLKEKNGKVRFNYSRLGIRRRGNEN